MKKILVNGRVVISPDADVTGVVNIDAVNMPDELLLERLHKEITAEYGIFASSVTDEDLLIAAGRMQPIITARVLGKVRDYIETLFPAPPAQFGFQKTAWYEAAVARYEAASNGVDALREYFMGIGDDPVLSLSALTGGVFQDFDAFMDTDYTMISSDLF